MQIFGMLPPAALNSKKLAAANRDAAKSRDAEAIVWSLAEVQAYSVAAVCIVILHFCFHHLPYIASNTISRWNNHCDCKLDGCTLAG
jgi:hypothetical protein